VVLVGTNDVLGVTPVSLAEFELNVRNMLQRLIDNGITAIASEVPPVIDSLVIPRHPGLADTPNNLIGLYNEAIHRAAEATSPTTPVVPLFEYFAPYVDLSAGSWVQNPANAGSSGDGIHLTTEGNRQLARLFDRFIPFPSASTRRVVLFGDSLMGSTIVIHPTFPLRNIPGDFLWQLVNREATAVVDWREYP
jgi:lysophospholipase L1-like esterase